jgi:hypothetical protein
MLARRSHLGVALAACPPVVFGTIEKKTLEDEPRLD